jgi:hypothetical protein
VTVTLAQAGIALRVRERICDALSAMLGLPCYVTNGRLKCRKELKEAERDKATLEGKQKERGKPHERKMEFQKSNTDEKRRLMIM